MKSFHWLSVLIAATLLGLLACKRDAPPVHKYGLKVDVVKLESELANSSPGVQSHVALLKHALRYSKFPEAIAELDYLANSPELSQPQKKLVEDLLEQTKQARTNAPSLP